MHCNAGIPASELHISDHALLRDTAVSFLHIRESGRTVFDPNTQNTPLEVDMESCKVPAVLRCVSWD